MYNQARDLFTLQTELVQMKVDMAVSRTIDRVVDQISALRHEMYSQNHGLREEMHSQIHGLREDMHGLRHEMRDRFLSLENRVTAVETKLGMSAETKAQVRSRLIDYGLKTLLAGVSLAIAFLILQLQAFIR